jgi:homoserine dehydrogenase
MTHYRLALIGFGNVGRALVQLLERKQSELESQYGITFSITGIATSRHGKAINPDGIDSKNALQLVEKGQSLEVLSALKSPQNNLDFIKQCPADVLFENTPVNHKTGQPAIDHLKCALEHKMHAITANKGPVVHGYHELTEIARKYDRRFMFESTVMDGAPIFSLFRQALPTAQLKAFQGILNSCTNAILGRMEKGETFEQAVAYAQSIGIAETDPSADVDGWDAAIKVAALVTVLMDIPLKPDEVEREGIRSITPEMINKARAEGKRWKLICSASRDGKLVHAKVAPQMVESNSPFFSVDGTSSIARFQTDVLPGLSIVEGDPGPETTAYGLLADFIHAVIK